MIHQINSDTHFAHLYIVSEMYTLYTLFVEMLLNMFEILVKCMKR